MQRIGKSTGIKFLVFSAFQTSDQLGTFKARTLVANYVLSFVTFEKISGTKRSINITDHFTCNLNQCHLLLNLHLLLKLFIGEQGDD